MVQKQVKFQTRNISVNRKERVVEIPAKPMDYYGENIFNYLECQDIPDKVKNEIEESTLTRKILKKDNAEIVAKAVLKWATEKGATHFCHWFSPLTGKTAEKHDSFLDLDDGKAIQEFKASQLMQGEPDASSFPNGGSRSTFEARGYTSWDITSPMFLMEGTNGKTLCIPTAFVSYNGQALDIKTPLLRSISALSDAATDFLNTIGMDDVKHVVATCGAEQEYFLVDRSFYFERPDLVMTGRTLFGSLSSRNQQLDDHYFGSIDDRVMSFMQELDYELYRLGIPSKTRHNEVAPGQYELAPIFSESNVSADNNMLMMAVLGKVAAKHNFVALLHEKPFAGINGSGKHVNWSMSTDTGKNLLEPGSKPNDNTPFLAILSIILEAVYRHADIIRVSIASAGNDHRLGANEAPPSIISAFIGDQLGEIVQNICEGKTIHPENNERMDTGAMQVATVAKDQTDRNRTSPFAFTGNKFELRAVGSDAAIGQPLTILNTAVAEVLTESTVLLKNYRESGKSVEDSLKLLTKNWLVNCQNVVFNGDGYSDDWIKEAEKRGLPNLRTTPDCLSRLLDKKATEFLTKLKVLSPAELETRYNVLVERYVTLRNIEFGTLEKLFNHNVVPYSIEYKKLLLDNIKIEKELGLSAKTELELVNSINVELEQLNIMVKKVRNEIDNYHGEEISIAKKYSDFVLPEMEKIADGCARLEELIPDSYWGLPKYYDMLFLR